MPKKLGLVRACTRCKSTTNEFGKCSKVSDGKTASCLKCQAELLRLKYHNDPEFKAKRLTKTSEWSKTNPEKVVSKVKAYQKRNAAAVKASHKCYVEANRTKVYSKNAARHCRKKNAAVSWANKFFIREAYELASLRTEMTGVKHVVDHVIPLNHPLVCGLHVEFNLQVIPEKLNLVKSNTFTPL